MIKKIILSALISLAYSTSYADVENHIHSEDGRLYTDFDCNMESFYCVWNGHGDNEVLGDCWLSYIGCMEATVITYKEDPSASPPEPFEPPYFAPEPTNSVPQASVPLASPSPHNSYTSYMPQQTPIPYVSPTMYWTH